MVTPLPEPLVGQFYFGTRGQFSIGFDSQSRSPASAVTFTGIRMNTLEQHLGRHFGKQHSAAHAHLHNPVLTPLSRNNFLFA